MTNYQNTHIFKHIVEAQQFGVNTLLNWIFPLADSMAMFAKHHFDYKDFPIKPLRGKIMISWFEESSTRTAASFAMAMNLLGGTVGFSTENASKFSSRAKGESIEDTIKILNSYYPDAIVARFNQAGDAVKAARLSRVPIINAGDGNNQHPTQALLDLYTIYKEFGRLNNIKIAMVGDMANGRTVKSLSYLAGKFDNIELFFVSPESLRISYNIKQHLDKHCIKYSETNDLRSICDKVDVIYMTRIQLERGSLLTEEEMEPGRFSISQEVLQTMQDDSIIMHPLPRVEEIPEFVDDDPRARYFEQAQNGLYIRMALLLMVQRPELVEKFLN